MSPSNTSPDEESPLLGNQNEHTTQPSQQDGAQDVPLVEEPSTKQIVLTLSPVFVGVFFAALDTTIVATLSAPISSSFQSLSLLSWLATAYLIANAACQPLSGKLTDIFSRRAGLVFSNIFFSTGCLICGLATTEWMIILGRVISGVGGGGLTAISTFVTSDLVPLRRRGVWQGYGNIVFGMGMGLGGVIGGWLNDVVGWRWAFLIQVPFVVVSGIMVFFLVKMPVKESSKPSLKRVDFLGAVLLTLALVLLLLGVNTGGNQLPWDSPYIISSLVLAVVFFGAFIYVEDKVATEPMIPVRLAATRTVLAACMANWFSTMAVFLALYYVPFYLQVRGLSSTQAGLRQIPVAVSTSVGSLGVGFVMRRTGKYYFLNAIMMALLVLGSALLCTFQLNTPTWATYVYVVPEGLGYGAMLTITLVAMISAVEHKDQAVITAASYAFRSTGSTIGITIASAVFQNFLSAQLQNEYGDKHGSAKTIKKIRNDLEELDRLPKGWDRDLILDFYMEALRAAFIAGLGLAVLATVASLFMREHTLHKNLARDGK
jgi:EmrB/QacA subfamily drug resistance transporter